MKKKKKSNTWHTMIGEALNRTQIVKHRTVSCLLFSNKREMQNRWRK